MFDALRDRKSGRTQESAASRVTDRKTTASGGGDATAATIGAAKSVSDLPPPGSVPQKPAPTVKEQMSRVAQAAPDIVSEPPATETRPDPASQKLTIVPGIHLKGEISNCDTLLVEGDIEASAVTRSIEISACGTFSGDAEIERADISGRFDGELTVADHLTIRSTGRVSGKIRYNSIEIEAGGQIAGDIQVSEAAKAESAPAEVEDESDETEVEDHGEDKPAARTA